MELWPLELGQRDPKCTDKPELTSSQLKGTQAPVKVKKTGPGWSLTRPGTRKFSSNLNNLACSSDDHHDSDHDIQTLQRTFSDEELSVFSWFIDSTGTSTQPDSEAIIFKFVDPRRAPGPPQRNSLPVD